MSALDPPEPPENDGLVSAFVHEVSEPAAGRMGPKVVGATLTVALVAGLAVGVGVMTHPKAKTAKAGAATPNPVAATSPAQPAPTPTAPGTRPVPVVSSVAAPPPQVVVKTVGGVVVTMTAAVPAVAPTTLPPPPTTSTSPHTFTALAGVGCAQTAAATQNTYGWYDNGTQGYIKVKVGGWGRQGGCNGSFDAMPMSGSKTADDPSNRALWVFQPGTAASYTCQLSVFVPNDTSIQHVGGAPAHYEIFNNADGHGANAGSFDINQPAHVNSWVTAGSFKAAGGVLTVKLDSRGQDFTSSGAKNGAHLAVAQMQVSCTG